MPIISFAQGKMESTHISWLADKKAIVHLSEYIDACPELGLSREDYDDGFLASITNGDSYPQDSTDTIAAESRLTYIAEAFFKDVLNGKPQELSHDGIGYSPDCIDVSYLVSRSVNENTFPQLLDRLESRTPSYLALKDTLSILNDSLKGILAGPKPGILDIKNLRFKISGVIRALNTIRWLNCLVNRDEYTIVVNIPSATLLLFSKQKVIFETKVIVGKRSTRTPVFISRLTDVTIYPYWNVPKNIATKELLPLIKKDISYIDNNNFQVLNSKGRVIDPRSIDWQEISIQNFPYTIRQSTGCDNSLGLIKLNLNHPNNIYLHDTPWKVLFESANRFYSHGCIRVENAKGLAHIILKDNSIAVDTLDETASPLEHRPRVLPVARNIVVMVLYNTAWFDKDGVIRFYPDIYSRFTKS